MVIVCADEVGHLLRRLDRYTGTFLDMLLFLHLVAALLRDRAARLDGLADWLVGAGLAGDGLAGRRIEAESISKIIIIIIIKLGFDLIIIIIIAMIIIIIITMIIIIIITMIS